MTLSWRDTLQRVTIAGAVRTLPGDETDRLVAGRRLAAGGPVPRSETWTRLPLGSVEFWYGGPDRLHRRLRTPM